MAEHKPKIQYRHEHKYILDPSEDSRLKNRLRQIFKHDQHADSHGSYRVSSLYFDTLSDQALLEKINGVNRREKFRLRYYGTEPDTCRLELKTKVNSVGHKRSVGLSLIQVEQIMAGDIAFLMELHHPLALEFYSKIKSLVLRPTVIISYDREAFIYPPGNVRVTLDRRLRQSHNWHKFLDSARQDFLMMRQQTILEVKYDQFLPDIVARAVQTNRLAVACSKYAHGRTLE